MRSTIMTGKAGKSYTHRHFFVFFLFFLFRVCAVAYGCVPLLRFTMPHSCFLCRGYGGCFNACLALRTPIRPLLPSLDGCMWPHVSGLRLLPD